MSVSFSSHYKWELPFYFLFTTYDVFHVSLSVFSICTYPVSCDRTTQFNEPSENWISIHTMEKGMVLPGYGNPGPVPMTKYP